MNGGEHMYKIGDYIVKSMNGVCRVEDITHLDIPGADRKKVYYLLIPVDDADGKIYAPAEVINTSTRTVMSEEDAWNLIRKIPEVNAEWIENDRMRQEKYKEVLKKCDPEALVGIIKMAYTRKRRRIAQGKKNTVIDERYFQMAENNLHSELGFALHKNKEEVCDLIADYMRQIGQE
jgi:CarD family transcriptional regulator